MSITTYFTRWFQWMLYEMYGLIIMYCDIILSNMGNFAEGLISFLVNNPFITTVQSNLQNFMWILLPVVIAGGAAYYLVLMKLDEVPKLYKGLWYFLVAIVCMNPLVGWLQDMTIEATNVAPELAGQEIKGNGLMGLANNMFVENPNWSKCIEESDGLKYADGDYYKGSRGKGFDHSRSDEGKWAVGVHVFTIFNHDWFLKTTDGVVNDLKTVGRVTYPLIPKDTDNGQPVIIAPNEQINATDNVVATRYMNTGCVIKGTTDSDGIYWYEASKYVFKWDLVPPLYGIAYALILLVGTIMALFKLIDLTIEMFICIMFLPVTALSNIVQGGWGEMFSNNVKELFKTCCAIFLQIFMVCFAIGIYHIVVTEIMRDEGFVNQLISNQWYSWTAGWIKLFFTTAAILVMFWFMLNGSDSLTKFMGIDTGIGTSAAAGYLLGKLGSMAGKGVNKAVGGVTNAGKGMAKGIGNKAMNTAFGEKDENGDRKRGIKNTMKKVRSNVTDGIEDKGNTFRKPSDKNGNIDSGFNNLNAKQKASASSNAEEQFNSMSKEQRQRAFAQMGVEPKGDCKFSDLKEDKRNELIKNHWANTSAKGKVAKAKNVINGGSRANINENGRTNRQQAVNNTINKPNQKPSSPKDNGWNVDK